MNWKYAILIALGTLGLGFWIGSEFYPKIETKVEERESTKKDVVTIVKEITHVDGSKERTETIVDRSKEKKQQTSTETEIAPLPQYKISVAALTSAGTSPQYYSLTAERRLFGPYWIGVSYNTKQEYGLSFGWEF